RYVRAVEMAYRDGFADPHIAELRRLIEAEPAEREVARQIRFAQDDATALVDRLGAELAAAERGGLRAMLRPTDVARLRDELAAAIATRAELVERERAQAARLDAIAQARDELAAREAKATAALRAGEGPAADELRAIEASIEVEAARLVAFEHVL